jgi:hypothetical protein
MPPRSAWLVTSAGRVPPSRQQLRSRLRRHSAGNAAGSTLRLTLDCLLASQLGVQLRRVGSGPGQAM